MRYTLTLMILVLATAASAQSKRVLVLVEQAQSVPLARSLATWDADVRADGFTSTRISVDLSWTPTQIKEQVRRWYATAPTARNHLFVVGSVATVKVYTTGPDGHGWKGMTPTDSWYGDLSNKWTTKTYNGVVGWAQSFPLGQLAGIGRVDFRPLSTAKIYAPASQTTKLVRYFAKSHAYRTGAVRYDGDYAAIYDKLWQWAVPVYAGSFVIPIGWTVRSIPKSATEVPVEKWWTTRYKFELFTPGGVGWPEFKTASSFKFRYISFCWSIYARNPSDVPDRTPRHVWLLDNDPLCVGLRWTVLPTSTRPVKDFLAGRITLGQFCMSDASHPVTCVTCGDPTVRMR